MCKMHRAMALPLRKCNEFEAFIAILQLILLATKSVTKLLMSVIMNMIATSRPSHATDISERLNGRKGVC